MSGMIVISIMLFITILLILNIIKKIKITEKALQQMVVIKQSRKENQV